MLNYSIAFSYLFAFLLGLLSLMIAVTCIVLLCNSIIANSGNLKLKYLVLVSSFKLKHFHEIVSYGDFVVLCLLIQCNSQEVVDTFSLLLYNVESRRDEIEV